MILSWYTLFLIWTVMHAQKNLVLIGGNLEDDNEQIYGKIIELAGGVGIANIGLVTAANEDAEGSAIFYEAIFREYGARDVYWIPVHENNTDANSDPEVVSRIHGMTGFFFGGGEQIRVINSFYNDDRVESPALAAIRSTYESGSVVSGTSAGAACMNSAVMIIGGLSYEAILKGAFPLDNQTDIDDLVYEPDGGIGFINDAIIDVHFRERGRQGRLIRLISDTRDLRGPLGTNSGIGIDENTALVIYNVDTSEAYGEIIGESGALFIDLSESKADTKSRNWGIVDINTHYLTEGDAINIDTFEVSFAAWKDSLKGNEIYNKAVTSNDIFNGNKFNPRRDAEYLNVTTHLFNSQQSISSYGLTQERDPRFKLSFLKETSSSGYEGINPRTGEFCISYTKLQVQIEEGSACFIGY